MEGVSSKAVLADGGAEGELPTSFTDILRDHGLDDESTPPSAAAWAGLLRAIRTESDDLALADAYIGFDAAGGTLRDPLLLVDSQGGIQRWNDAAEPMMVGCEPGGQHSFHDIVRGARGERHGDLEADFADAIREHEEPMEGFLDGLRGYPDRGPFAYRIIPIGFEEVVGAAIRFVDQTELRLLRERAETAQEEAGDVERTRAQFVTNTSHELRTPLNGILGMTNLLRDTKLNSEQREFVEIIQTSGENLLSLVNDILDFSKFEAGRFELEIIDYDLERLVRDLADLLAPKAHDSGIELIVDLPPDVPIALLGDPGRIRQVLTNLASNAIKFTSQGEVVLGVRSLTSEDGAPRLRFEVSDTGVGIAPHAIERLFRPFQQADSSTTREYGGTGLGLAICKQIVDMMEGEIGVDSELDKGSTFWFELPLHKQPVIRSLQQSETNDFSRLQGKRILIAEQNSKQLEILKNYLESWGAIVTCAADAQEVERVSEERAEAGEPFDIILLDDVMAGQSPPIPSAKRVRQGHRVVMNTRLKREAGIAPRVRPDASIRKPVRPRLLLDTIQTLVESPWLPGEGPDSRVVGATQPGTERVTESTSPLILLAEDNIVNQKVATQVLAKMGYAVEVVGNGELAFKTVQERSYAAILMDCQMPVMSGYEAATAIREWEAGTESRVPIIALTAHALPGDRQRCLDAGMDDYVTKPLRAEILQEALERWIVDEWVELAPGEEPSSGEDPNPSDAPAEPSCLDAEAIERLRLLEDPAQPGFVAEILTDYLRGLDDQLARIQDAIFNRNAEALRAASHTFKGSSASIGAERLRDLALRIESLASSPGDPELQAAMEEMKEAAKVTRAALEELPELSP